MVRFYGKASAKVDDKGRVVFPAIFRDAFTLAGESDLTLVIKPSVHNACLDLYTLEEWKRRSDRELDKLDPELNPDHAAFWSKFNENVFYVVPDGTLCRLKIPAELLEKTGITKDVVFAGVGYKIEVWAKDRRDSALLSDEAFKRTATRLSESK